MKLGCVVISRNDGYGGDQPIKAIYSIASLISAFDEVIYVDWNSPDDVSLIEVIRDGLPKTGKLRAIQVTQAKASELTNHTLDRQNCVEVMARNIGIRRLTSDYIVSCNADVMCATRVSIERGIINDRTFHVIARRETPLHEAAKCGAPGTETIARCMENHAPHFRQHADGSPLAGDPWSMITCPGDFQLAHQSVWDGIKGFEEELIMRGYSDSNVQRKAVFYGFDLKLVRTIPVFHFQHYPDTGACGGNTMGWNDQAKALTNFQGTTNPDTWGFTDMEFPEEKI